MQTLTANRGELKLYWPALLELLSDSLKVVLYLFARSAVDLAVPAPSVVASVIQEALSYVNKAKEDTSCMVSSAGELAPAAPGVMNTLYSHVSANLNLGSENTLAEDRQLLRPRHLPLPKHHPLPRPLLLPKPHLLLEHHLFPRPHHFLKLHLHPRPLRFPRLLPLLKHHLFPKLLLHPTHHPHLGPLLRQLPLYQGARYQKLLEWKILGLRTGRYQLLTAGTGEFC